MSKKTMLAKKTWQKICFYCREVRSRETICSFRGFGLDQKKSSS
jgi:hypothetical protein